MKLFKFRKQNFLFVLLVMSVFFVGCNKDSDIEKLKADGYSKYEITKKIKKEPNMKKLAGRFLLKDRYTTKNNGYVITHDNEFILDIEEDGKFSLVINNGSGAGNYPSEYFEGAKFRFQGILDFDFGFEFSTEPEITNMSIWNKLKMINYITADGETTFWDVLVEWKDFYTQNYIYNLTFNNFELQEIKDNIYEVESGSVNFPTYYDQKIDIFNSTIAPNETWVGKDAEENAKKYLINEMTITADFSQIALDFNGKSYVLNRI